MATTPSTGLRVTGIDATTYLVKDTDRAIAFYRDVLGMEVSRRYSEGAEFDLSDGSTFGIWNPAGYMPWQACTGVLFSVDDFEGAVRTARERGATIHHVEETQVCHMAIGVDSEGNGIILHKRKS